MMRLLWILFVALILLEPKSAQAKSSEKKVSARWETIRTQRLNSYNAFLKHNVAGFQSLVNGSNGKGEIPALMFRVFPKLFPEIWGDEKNQFALPGMSANPYAKKGQRYIPLGMALSEYRYDVATAGGTAKLNYVGFNCAACHTGQVRVGTKLSPIWGAPNNRINGLFFKLSLTTQHPNFNISAIRKALKTIPVSEFSDPTSGFTKKDFDLFMDPRSGAGEKIVGDIKQYGTQVLGVFNKFIRPVIYGDKVNSPDPFGVKRGTNDALIATIFGFTANTLGSQLPPDLLVSKLKDGLPTSAAETDNPSIWAQKGKGKYSHWDGSFTNLFHRNVATAVATHNTPVNFRTMEAVTDFITELPPPPYPFELNALMASRGRQLYQNHCASCHSGETKILDYARGGTSKERFSHAPFAAREWLGKQMIKLCVPCATGIDPKTCSVRCAKPDGSPYLPEDIMMAHPAGYIADNLDGVWARAPYLHNGSIPTLYHLLVPASRPKTFYRGSFLYDQKKVGFTWESPRGDTDARIEAVLFDTSKIGNGNGGHDTPEYLGLNWGAPENSGKLRDLLEYMKTL